MIHSLKAVTRRWGLLCIVVLCNLLVSAIVALPWSQALAISAISQFPEADAALFAPGGLILIEWFRIDGSFIAGAMRTSAWLGLPGAVLLLVPLAFLFAGLCNTDRFSYRAHGQRAVSATPALLLLFVLTFLTQASLLFLLITLWGAATSGLIGHDSAWLTLATAPVGGCLWLLPSILQDLSRAGIVGRGLNIRRALFAALGTLHARPLAVLASYGGPALLRLAVTLLGLMVTRALAPLLEPRLAWLLFSFHQLCFVFLVALRAIWFHRALQLMDALVKLPREPDGKRERSDGLGGPNPSPSS